MIEKHTISNRDYVTRTADCDLCGRVRIKPKGATWSCVNKIAEGQLKFRYGVGLRWRDERLIALGNRCSCCGGKPGPKGLFVDHNHTTGEVRDLVCEYCNFMLGQARDNPDILRKGAEYLEKWRN